MNVTVIGATGMVGTRLVAEAASRGHRVTAVARKIDDSLLPEGVRGESVDVKDPEKLAPVLGWADSVVVALRPPTGQEHTLAPLTRNVFEAAGNAGVPILIIGGAGPLTSPDDAETLVVDDTRHVAEEWRAIALASTEQLRVCHEYAEGTWVYLSPPAILAPGTRTGEYRRGTTTLLTAPDGTSHISVEDLAVAAVDEVENPAGERHFTVARA